MRPTTVEVLSPAELAAIDQASLELLQEAGITVRGRDLLGNRSGRAGKPAAFRRRMQCDVFPGLGNRYARPAVKADAERCIRRVHALEAVRDSTTKPGMFACGETSSPERLVTDDDLIAVVRRIARGITVDEELDGATAARLESGSARASSAASAHVQQLS